MTMTTAMAIGESTAMVGAAMEETTMVAVTMAMEDMEREMDMATVAAMAMDVMAMDMAIAMVLEEAIPTTTDIIEQISN